MRGSDLSQAPDPYIDGESGVLRNLVEARTRKDLAAAESDLTTARTIQLLDHDLIEHSRDLVEVRALHRQLFQDVYVWAGELRTIDMRRGEGHFFAFHGGLLDEVSRLAREERDLLPLREALEPCLFPIRE